MEQQQQDQTINMFGDTTGTIGVTVLADLFMKMMKQ